ncbi:MAG: DNA polymerase III alpha subunit [Candidatus Ozemobacter sibiricus]|uniref:DNA-directed DNA polymerase n=1 Tax=Candidatus Ozemobacter sibiricus TaxID=2268124 RepID=A0A367ZQQ4_9BACT|nr:MAG: DNA polymerase III alpha subunit [Candidatus Ozemobacter sibiricus]
MYHTNFVHLHVHSHYSLLDGAAPVKAIVEAARKYRMPAVAITDHGNMFGTIDFYQTAIKRGVKPIIGFEAYMAPGKRTEKTPAGEKDFHLVLLARTNDGYKNLVKLSTLAYTEGFSYRPRIDRELLETYGGGLLALGACLQGEIPARLLKGDLAGARQAANWYRDVFGADNFYLEVQNHGLPEQLELLPRLVEFARDQEIPLVATNDSHYVNPEDWEAHEALLCIQTRTTLNDPNRFKFGSREFYFKPPAMMADLFPDLPDAITNTLRVAEKCNVRFTLGKPILPHFPIPEGKTSESYLEELCRQALPERYPQADEKVLQRLEYELSVIRRMGFCDYFLIVWDFIRAARDMGVPVGPGRGSAAGSMVAYLLRITDLEPLRYGLLFERFLNPDRISMPDIDIDFSDDGRGRVIDYVVQKYGRDRVSQIATFSAILAKTAIRDIGRVMGMPLAEVDRIAKLVPEKPGIHLKQCLAGKEGEVVPELKEIWENGTPDQKRLLKNAMTVDGLYRHSGIHAAGVVISREPLMDIVPMFKDKSGEIITQFEKNAIEKIGLLKMDFLGLKTLTVIQRALEYIKETRHLDIDFDRLGFDDKATYELMSKGFVQGVFQLDSSSGMRSLVMRLKPSVFEDLIALLAMYRPGPLGSGMVDDFVERKHGRQALVYPHPDLEPILRDTYGVFLYQEQCMQTANVLAGFTMAQADGLRKAMAKKIAEDMEKNGKMFVEGAVKRGIDKGLAESIFAMMAKFGEYGFNKSHSAAYAVLTYRTAYLKAHFPTEFMAAVLSSEINDTDKIAIFVDDCRALNISVLPPDINRSRQNFTVEEGSIRYGLAGIKGVGEKAIESILKARHDGGPFKSLADFTRRVDTRVVNNQVLEALIHSGAMDVFGWRRSQLVAMATDALRSGQALAKERQAGQATFFDLLGSEAPDALEADLPPPDLPEFPERERLDAEKKALGFYLTGDPFGEFVPLARLFSTHALPELAAGEGQICRIAGLLTSFKKHPTKKGDVMAFLTIEADNVSLDVTVFPSLYQEMSARWEVDQPLFLVVRPEMQGEDLKAVAEKILTLKDLQEDESVKLRFIVPPEHAAKETYQELLRVVRRFPGPLPFTIQIFLPSGERVVLKPPPLLKVSLAPGLIKEWEKICGRGTVKAQFPQLEAIRDRPPRGPRNGNGGNGYGNGRRSTH